MNYLISLAVGLVVGVAYALIGVRSPAPPLVALAGLLGMVGGEQLVPMVKGWVVTPEKEAIADAQDFTNQSARLGDPLAARLDRATESK
jgi:XapX domain-containing protein